MERRILRSMTPKPPKEPQLGTGHGTVDNRMTVDVNAAKGPHSGSGRGTTDYRMAVDCNAPKEPRLGSGRGTTDYRMAVDVNTPTVPHLGSGRGITYYRMAVDVNASKELHLGSGRGTTDYRTTMNVNAPKEPHLGSGRGTTDYRMAVDVNAPKEPHLGSGHGTTDYRTTVNVNAPKEPHLGSGRGTSDYRTTVNVNVPKEPHLGSGRGTTDYRMTVDVNAPKGPHLGLGRGTTDYRMTLDVNAPKEPHLGLGRGTTDYRMTVDVNAPKELHLGSGYGTKECRMTVDVNAPVGEIDEVMENPMERSQERALNESGGAANGEPSAGMEFESEDAVKAFYYDYAMHVGFSVRANLRRRSMRDGSTIGLEFVCSKEGYRRENHTSKRAETRKGCKAMIKVKKAESGKWVVTRFDKEHNHELETPRKLPLLRARRRISNAVKKPNYIPSLRKRTLGRDSQYLLDYFNCMQAKNPSFFYAVQLDGEYRMTNFFWIDARSRMTYSYFGDVVIFDTTYKTNRYGMPFAPFLGANHHKQPILFGCALLLDESEDSLVWLFNTWLEAMSGRHPISIVAEQDPALGAAIAKVFPRTSHRFCKRHILREFHDRLGHVDSDHKDFISDFFKCINMTELNDELESCWWSFIDKYELKENEWLQSLYKTREQWVQVYLQDTFMANMSVNQLSENINSFFGGYLKIHTPLQEFVNQLEKIINSQYEKELEEDCKTRNTKPLSKTGLPMENQLAEIYTETIFLDFQEQLFQSLRHIADIVKDDGPVITFRVVEFGVGKMVYTVTFDVLDVKASCSCQMFEYAGIPCRHILRVFSVKNIMLLPSNYILKRWTRNATSRVVPDDHDIEAHGGCQESRSLRFNDLCRQAVKYASEGATTSNIYNVAMHALRKAFEEVVTSKKDDWMVGQATSLVSVGVHRDNICEESLPDNTAGHITFLDPRRRVTRGQPDTRVMLENQRLHGGIGVELGFSERILGVPSNSAIDMYEPTGLFSLEPDNFPQVAHGTRFRDRDTFPH